MNAEVLHSGWVYGGTKYLGVLLGCECTCPRHACILKIAQLLLAVITAVKDVARNLWKLLTSSGCPAGGSRTACTTLPPTTTTLFLGACAAHLV